MRRDWDEADLIADGFERVYTESERYDWPRAGLADVGGQPHYYDGWAFDRADDMYEYYVWPASEEAVAWELEWWAIYIAWELRREAGEAGEDSHPGLGGINTRYDELVSLLAPHRQIPEKKRKLLAERRFDNGDSFRAGDTGMWFRWHSGEDADASQ
ncbi:hypothetical protein ACFWWS_37810 [Streptomyces sp. NPDC059083]|uniref:hypothetical protein n=1 Tax=Streptomyces sp. NPDC059083 TaxID=3346721 RepID=UPI0036C63B11